MSLRACLTVAALLWGPAAFAQELAPAAAAQAALEQVQKAEVALDKAKGGRDRVAALSQTVRAFEAGLGAVRSGLRRVTIRERQLSLELTAQEEEIAQLLSVLQARGRAGSPSLFLHPKGPLGTARAGMIVTEMTPALSLQAAELREKLVEVSTLRHLQTSAEDTLRKGLTGVQTARIELNQAIADRVDLPKKFIEDPVKTALLIATSDTLDSFATSLWQISGGPVENVNENINARKGSLALPVAGRILRRAGEADAAGIKREGILIATRPRALVVSPVAATVRYQGPLLTFGNVMILEPQNGLLMVFAGLDVVYGTTGDVLVEGAPIGLMGGQDAAVGEILTQVENGAGSDLSETLYLEVREDNTPVNPEGWFRSAKDN